jgi:signal transduction histidine kinase
LSKKADNENNKKKIENKSEKQPYTFVDVKTGTDERLQNSERLEELVKEKTDELTNAERLAGIGETAGMIGHDIRNPLQSITGAVYLMKDEIATLPDNESKQNLQENINLIEQQTDYISKIVADLQDYAKKLCPEIKAYKLQDIVEESLSMIKIPENIQITSKIPPDTPKVKTDLAYIKRTLINLFTNSIQAMPKGGKIAITSTETEGKIHLNLYDTGNGIPKDVREKIFKPLFTTKSKGQGFGLAFCKRLMEAQNSTITFTSEQGNGTTFTIHLSTAQ